MPCLGFSEFKEAVGQELAEGEVFIWSSGDSGESQDSPFLYTSVSVPHSIKERWDSAELDGACL